MGSLLLNVKIKATAIHLFLSFIVVGLVACVVFFLWFPYPYNEVSGGRTLFWLIIGVDLCCGPLLTFVLFNQTKSRRELMLDLGLVVIIQLAFLCYGLYTVMLARPAYVVFEVDRFRVVAVVDVVTEELPLAKKEFQTASLWGPEIIAAQPPLPSDEDYVRTLELGMQGIDISSRPRYWVPYSDTTAYVLKRAKSIANLKQKNPEKINAIDTAVKESALQEGALVYLPMQSRTTFDWVVLLDAKDAKIVGYVKANGF